MNARRIAFRRFGAVFAGLLVVVVTSTATDAVLHATGVFPPMGQPMPDSLFVLALAYRIIYAIAGGYVAARLAPERPMWHAFALGFVGVVLATAGTVATWDRGPEFGPHWYPVALIATSIPCSWVGGKVFCMRARGRTVAPATPRSQANHA